MQTARLQIRSHLSEMDVFQPFDRLQFHEDPAIDDEIDAVRSDFLVLESHADFPLLRVRDAAMLEGDGQRLFVNAFQETGSEGAMDFNGGRQDSTRQLFELVAHRGARPRIRRDLDAL